MSNFKKCSFCGNFFPYTEDYFYHVGPRLQVHCKSCCIKRSRNHCLKKLSEDPEYKNVLCERSDSYYNRNKEKVSARSGKYKKAKGYKDISAAYRHKRKAASENLIATFTEDEWEVCKESFDNKCAYCGKESILTRDHFVAVTKNGEYAKGNIVPACVSCNCSKGNKSFLDWYTCQSFYSETRKDEVLKYLGYNKYGVQLMAFF